MSSLSNEEISDLFKRVAPEKWGHNQLKPEQVELISKVLNKEKVSFGILPTGFGKSDVYAATPIILDEIDPENRPHISLVVSPLRSLMKDQVKRWTLAGISAAAILTLKEMEDSEIQAIMKGEVTLVFTSPEAIMNEPWRSMLHAEVWQQKLCMVACDEAHCIHDWGLDFRPAYKEVSQLRGVLDVPWVYLTATCTSEMLQTVVKVIGSPETYHLVSAVPDRPNIFLDFEGHPQSYHREIRDMVSEIKDKKQETPKAIIYCSSTEDLCDIFESFYQQLGDAIYIPGEDRQQFGSMMVAEFHRGIGKDMENKIMNEIIKTDSRIRILISTVAFGMGVEVKDVRQVIHWGISSSVPAYWQEVGRGGRDSQPACAKLFAVRVTKQKTTEAMYDMMQDFRKGEDSCMRRSILKHFILPGMDLSTMDKMKNRQPCTQDCGVNCECDFCMCCTFCKATCSCVKN